MVWFGVMGVVLIAVAAMVGPTKKWYEERNQK
jgi:hypothetical protein